MLFSPAAAIGRTFLCAAIFLAALPAGRLRAESVGESAGSGLVRSAPIAPPVELPEAGREPPGVDRIRIGCFNVGWYSGVPGAGFVPRSTKDYLRIARVVRATHVDALQLEEVTDEAALKVLCAGLNQLSRGTTDFRFTTPEGESLFIPCGNSGERQSIGFVYDARRVTLHAPRAIVELGRTKFTRLPVQVSLRAVGARLRFDLIGVHLKSGMLRDEDVDRRSEEVRLLTEWLYLQRKGDKDFVLLGDFNSPRDHESMAAIDALADQGKLVAIEDHLAGKERGTHIPFDVALDRAFMSPPLWKRTEVAEGAWIYRFDDFMPRAHEIDDFCIYSRSRVWKKELRCDCEGKSREPGHAPPAGSAPPTGLASFPGPGPDEPDFPTLPGPQTDAEAPTECSGDVQRWIKSANYLRVSDHRPLLWDLKVRQTRRPARSQDPAAVSTAPTPVASAAQPAGPAPGP